MLERHITFIRHGEALNNLSNDKKSKYTKNEMYDCPLTNNGREQCARLRDKMKDKYDRIYVSSLNRALETADIVFKDTKTIITVLDMIREYKSNITSYRKPLSGKKISYPHFDFDIIYSEQDMMLPEVDVYDKKFCIIKYKKKTMEDFMMNRVKEFLDQLALTVDKRICVISHRGFINMFGRFYEKYIDIDNCETYSMKFYL